MSAPDVDLVVNCFERTYREVLRPETFARICADNARDFAVRTALVNNVDDVEDARRRGEALVAAGGADRVVLVADVLDRALQRTGMRRDELSWHLDWALCVVTLDGPDHVLHWDADVRLRAPVDWVTPALELLAADPRVAVANPNWEDPNLAAFTVEDAGRFALGRGFSDQVFLARRSQLGAPVYHQRCVARWRYPYPDSFEARVDAWMRHAGLLRATHREALYEHPVEMGTSWPDRTLRAKAARKGRGLAVDVLRASPWRPRHLREL